MFSNKKIEHPATVIEIKSNGNIIAKIISASACSSCNNKSSCGILTSETKEKLIEIKTENTYKIGQDIIIQMNQSLGNLALFIGYLIPLLLLIISIVILYNITSNEAIIGLTSIGILIPYYFSIYLLKNKLKNKFEFTIK